MTLTLVAAVAIAVACGLAVVVWTQYREARQRSAARVAALAAAIDGPLDTFSFAEMDPQPRGHVPLESFADAQTTALPRRGWIIAAGAVPAVLVVAALLVTRGPRQAPPPPAARQPQSLELLDMRHNRAGDLLTVTGTVRVRGRDTAPVTAVVTGRDAAGRIVASAHAPIDDAALDIGGESSFQVSVSGGDDVRRYQVRFETPLGPLAHIDRRAAHTAAVSRP
jgi:hypothetical protein